MNQQVFEDLVRRLDRDLTDFCRLYGILCIIKSTTQYRFCGQSIDCHLSIPSIRQGELDDCYTYNKMVDIMIEDPEYVDYIYIYIYQDFYRTVTEYILDKRYTYVASVYRRHKIQINKPEILSIPMSILTLEDTDIDSLEFLKLVSKATGEHLC